MPIIVTGFEPFNAEPVNPTQKLVERLRESAAEALITAVLPVDAATAPGQIIALLEQHRPSALLMMGVAMGRAVLSVERVAINVLDFNIPDNAGARIHDEPIVAGGPAAYFATIPVRDVRDRLVAGGIPADISNSAGTYLCNQVFYTALHWTAQHAPQIRAGFLHVPALPSQVAVQPRPGPSMALDTMLSGVRIMLDLFGSW